MAYEYSEAASINNDRDRPERVSMSEDQIIRKFCTFIVRQNKRWAPVWMPATFTHPSREAEYVDRMHFFVADLDSCTEHQLRKHMDRWMAMNLKFIVHSSHGWAPPEKAKARVIFFLSEPIEIGTQWRWSDALWPALMKYVGLSIDADPSCRDASRAFYVPVKPTAASECLDFWWGEKPIDVRAVLGHILDEPLAKYDFRREYINQEDPSIPVDRASWEAILRHNYRRGDMKKIVEMVLTATPTPDGMGRHEVIRKFTMALAYCCDPRESTAALLTLMDPWIGAMTAKYGQRGEAWRQEAERALIGAREKKPTWDAYAASQLEGLD